MSEILEVNSGFQKFVIDVCVDFRLACKQYGLQLNETKSGVCYCPFHYNKNTPSAKIYQDGLYCFSENKFYRASNLFDYGLVRDSYQNAFTNIWCLLTDCAKSELKVKYSQIRSNDEMSFLKKELLPLYAYKLNKIDYKEYCSRLMNTLTEISNKNAIQGYV